MDKGERYFIVEKSDLIKWSPLDGFSKEEAEEEMTFQEKDGEKIVLRGRVVEHKIIIVGGN